MRTLKTEKRALQTEMSKSYEIKMPSEAVMRIVLTDMSFKYEEEELINKSKKQNQILVDSDIKVLQLFETRRKNKVIHNVRLKIDCESYNKVMMESFRRNGNNEMLQMSGL